MSSGKKDMELDWKRSVMLYVHDLVYMLITILLVFLLFFRIVVVSGESMYPTLLDGDYILLLNTLICPDLQQGDIVVISKDSFDNGNAIVKRIIATEGQTVDIDFDRGIVYVDGVALEENYINSPTHQDEGMEFPLEVSENCIFVLGDNRGISMDSRHPRIGQIDKREVLGKAVFLLVPGTNYGEFPRERDRIGVMK